MRIFTKGTYHVVGTPIILNQASVMQLFFLVFFAAANKTEKNEWATLIASTFIEYGVGHIQLDDKHIPLQLI